MKKSGTKQTQTQTQTQAAQCPEWTWEDRCALPAGHPGAHECAAAAARRTQPVQHQVGEQILFQGRTVGIWTKCAGCGTVYSQAPGATHRTCGNCSAQEAK